MRILKIVGISCVFLLIALSIVTYLCKDRLFHYLMDQKISAFEKSHQCNLTISSADLIGISGFTIQGITLTPVNKDTLLKIGKVNGRISFLELFQGNIALSELEISPGNIHAVRKNGTDNYSFLLQSKRNSDTAAVHNSYATTLNKLLNKFFKQVPEKLILSKIDIKFTDSLFEERLEIPELSLINTNIKGALLLAKDQSKQWNIEGTLDKSNRRLNVQINSNSQNNLPLLKERFQLELGFDNIQIALHKKDFSNDELKLEGEFSAKEFRIRHPKLDSNEVAIKNGNLHYHLLIGKKSFTFLDQTSGRLNDITFSLKASADRKTPQQYSLNLSTPLIDAQSFFNSLPEGLFSNFKAFKVSGKLALRGDFSLNMDQIDSVKFDCKLDSKNFKILQYGETDFSKMNTSFIYTAYEKEVPVKSFRVGPENPLFAPIGTISDYLKNAILISEDGSFFWHKGFREDAFRKALAENIKKGKFARGGSTISMQLVKNVFLSRRKTIARKLEEALIVWLIEQNRLTSKERMYEVYLNIIEWGPGIYGVSEASSFYFNKRPADLSLEESIFMASIIPRPKYFKYSFDQQGNLKPYLESYYRRVGKLMTRKGIITLEQDSSLVPNVILTGPARSMVVKEDLPRDSTLIDMDYDSMF